MKQVITEARKLVRGTRASLRLAAGAWQFSRNRATPAYAYQSLIQLFCLTRGRSNDLMSQALAVAHRPYRWDRIDGVLGPLSDPEVSGIAADLRSNGFHVFAQRMPAWLCDRLEAFARTQESVIRPMDQEANRIFGDRKAVYDPSSPQGIIYQFEQDVLINQPELQALMADTSLLAVAQAYIGSQPVLDEVNLWWSTAYGRNADSNAAQLYHFDMDRIRWLKFFVYLTDVGPDNGPHCFVAGSHKTRGIPSAFLDRGYARIADDEVQAAYPQNRLIEFTGPRGTIIAEDTRGLHKGRPVLRGHRLVLEFEFSNSLFGATSPHRVSRIRQFHSGEVERFVRTHERVYEHWLKDQ
jgi:hypothetical protein